MFVFKERGKPEYPEKNPRNEEEQQQQTQPTYDAGSGNRTWDTLVGGNRSHYCANPALLKVVTSTSSFYRVYLIKRPGCLFNFWTFRGSL